MQKSYSRINWENFPSESTPLNESNLNRMDYAIDTIDDRVIGLDTEKADVTTVDNLIASIAVDDETGVITITKQNGAQVTIQTTLNKIAVNFSYDYDTQELVLTMNDGTSARINLSSLIQNNEFANTSTINLSVSTTGIVTANIVDHSIGDNQLRTDYLSDIRTSEAHADQYQQDSQRFSLDSEAWAKGTRAAQPVTEGQDGYQDNSKYYKGRSEAWATGQVEGVTVPTSDIAYQNNSKHYVGRSEAWAVGEFQGDPVLPGDPTYENNSKYYSDLSASIRDATEQIRSQAADLLQSVTNRLTGLNIMINYSDGCLYYDINSGIRLVIDPTSGDLLYEVVV
jgi:hypothetical protein